MKNKIFITVLSIVFFTSCANLDLNPLSEGASGNWYSDETEISMSLNDLYREYLWNLESNFEMDRNTDDWTQRQTTSAVNLGTVTSEFSFGASLWLNTYKGIARANTILINLDKAAGAISKQKIDQFAGEARFFRAVLYSRLIFLYGDVPFYTGSLTIDEAFKLGRTDKKIILGKIYEDFDLAIQNLPKNYPGTE